jgi:hypothetical protein
MQRESHETTRLDTYTRHYNPTIVKQHIAPGTEHRIYHFENGYGASVIPEYSALFVSIPGCLELAVVKWDDRDEFHLLDYDDPIISQLDLYDNPIRCISEQDVDGILDRIAGL